MIIAIDGPSASGKTTTAKGIAEKLGILHIDTGAMYRAVTLGFQNENILPDENVRINHFLIKMEISFENGNKIHLNGKDVSKEIRKDNISSKVSNVSAIKDVRKRMVDLQRNIAENDDCVLEGRDIGTVVFPNADFKFFINADLEVRAKRRFLELEKMGENISLDRLILDIKRRDDLDSSRKLSPLKKAKDAIVINTSYLTIYEQIDKIIDIIKKNKETLRNV
tara:strand:+ start:298 stop:966 length:669 start_codon:yes stop_codon:yes gene_type:complete